MSSASGALILLLILELLPAGLRSLRIAQREHYIGGALIESLRRWVTCRPPNKALVVGWLGAVGLSTFVRTPSWLPLLGAGIGTTITALWPWGLKLQGTPPVRWTRRLRLLALVSTAIAVLLICAVWNLIRPPAAVAAGGALWAVAVEVGLAITAPIETRIARRYIKRASAKLRTVAPRVIAVTGSFGKTTTKNHIRDLLAPTMNVFATPASWNNRAGLSRAITEQLAVGTEVFVAEMGTYGPGEISDLVDWAKPEVAVLCALGPVHLERMGSLDAILAAKSEVLKGCDQAVVAVDHPQLRALADQLAARAHPYWTGNRIWRVGTDRNDPSLDVVATRDESTESIQVEARSDPAEHRRPVGTVDGESIHPSNVACAVGAALALGVDPDSLRGPLDGLKAPASRAEVVRTDDGVLLIDDTFNSNPAGAMAALETLRRDVDGGRVVVVTPGMVELGTQQHDANASFARAIAAAGADLVIVGWTNRAALAQGFDGESSRVVRVPDRSAAREWVRANVGPGDGVLWENDLPDHYP